MDEVVPEPEYRPFGSSEDWGNPAIHEFTNVFPEFPKTHEKGYAYIIELNDEQLLNEAAVLKLRDGLQYSRINGKGRTPRANVEFFSGKEGLSVPMIYWFRQCGGINTLILLHCCN
jgi:hypothetical protein